MLKYFVMGFVMLMYNFIATFTWSKIGKTALEKISVNKSFGIKQFIFYIITQIVVTIVMCTALCGVMSDPEL